MLLPYFTKGGGIISFNTSYLKSIVNTEESKTATRKKPPDFCVMRVRDFYEK